MNVIIGTIALFSTLTSSLTNNNTAYSDETSTEKDSLPGAIPDLTQACANRIAIMYAQCDNQLQDLYDAYTTHIQRVGAECSNKMQNIDEEWRVIAAQNLNNLYTALSNEMITTSNTMETKLDTILYLLTSSDEEFIPTVRNYYDGYTAQESFYPANAILGNLDDIIDG